MNIATRLSDHISSRGFAAKVARLSGVDRETIIRIARKKTLNPGVKTVEAIEDALDTILRPAQPTNPSPGQKAEG
ncbi:MAG: helix-turn-helix domain-containing protein [Acidobacteriota bacterium]